MQKRIADPQRIRPATDERDLEIVNDLAVALRRQGWTGPAVAVVESRGEYQALGDDFKVLAARDAGLAGVPVLVLDPDESIACRASAGWDAHLDRPADVSEVETVLMTAGFDEAAALVGRNHDDRARFVPAAA